MNALQKRVPSAHLEGGVPVGADYPRNQGMYRE